MKYNLIERTSTSWGNEEKVYASFANKTDADKKLDELYSGKSNNRKFVISYVKGDFVKIVDRERPQFNTTYTIEED